MDNSNASDRRYLKIGNKLAYGSGDMATNFFYGVVTAFMLIYLTDAVGLNSGIVGTLMAVSRVLDGITDVLFGSLIDRTKSRFGKARPWMLWTIIPIAVSEVLLFSMPRMSATLQYVYFFVIYTIVNDFFFTANNVAYSTLSALMTPNKNERVQLGVFRFAFTTIASLVVSAMTLRMVNGFGGGTAGWRGTALVYAVLFTAIQLICFFGTRETTNEGEQEEPQEKKSLFGNLKVVFTNPYFVMQLLLGTFYNVLNNITVAVGAFYVTHKLHNPDVLGMVSLTQVFPLIIGLVMTPALVKRWGMYKVNLISMIISTAACIPFALAGMKGMIPVLLAASAVRWLGAAPQIANSNALIAEVADYSYNRDHIRVEGSIFSCSSMGTKIGQGLGTAAAGWLLALVHYDGTLEVQTAAAVNMISFIYAVIPLIITAIMTIILYFYRVEKANETLRRNANA